MPFFKKKKEPEPPKAEPEPEPEAAPVENKTEAAPVEAKPETPKEEVPAQEEAKNDVTTPPVGEEKVKEVSQNNVLCFFMFLVFFLCVFLY